MWLIEGGARFIATNPDVSGPNEAGTVPGCGAMAALIEKASGKAPFYVGKPNPLMMRSALNYLDVHSEDTVMVGDRMETDIVAGVESGMRTILALSGSTGREDIDRFPYRPSWGRVCCGDWAMRIAKAMTYLASLLAAAALASPMVPLARLLIWPLKLTGGALTPILGIVSGLGALLGLVRHDWKMAGTGAAGTAMAVQFLQDVPDSKAGFDAVFGTGWEQRIPAPLQLLMLPRRWSLLAREPGRAILQRDIVYAHKAGTGTPLLADLWSPPPSVAPTGLSVVYVHGGGWRIGYKDMLTRPFFRRLAAQGHTILDIEYTVCPEGDIPTMIAEVKEAILWIKAYSREYGLDPERVVLMGGSAGGHLALLAAYTSGHPSLPPMSGEGDASVRGVVAFYPPTDFSLLQEPIAPEIMGLGGGVRSLKLDRVTCALLARLFDLPCDDDGEEVSFRDMIPDLIGGTPDEIPEVYRLLSPIDHVGAHCPSTLLLQGTDDIFDLTAGVRRLHQKLQEAGAGSILVEFPHAEHAFDLVLPQLSPVAQAATYNVERFLALLV